MSAEGSALRVAEHRAPGELGTCVVAGGTALLPSGRLEEADLVIEGGRVRVLGAAGTVGADVSPVEIIDARGHIVAPGFVDTHVHGGLGANFMAGDADSVATISRHLAAGGVTSCLAATASTGPDELYRALTDLAGAVGPVAGGIEILGIHLEGPFLNDAFRGVHRREHVRAPEPAELHRLWAAAGPALRVVTLAPELPGGEDAIDFFVSRGVVVSVGHSGADYREALAAIAGGASRATHMWNGLPPLHHRAPGPVLALLESPTVFLELVADGLHVSPEMLRHTVGLVGRDRVVLVSDGTDVAGLPEGRHRRWEGTEVLLADGASRTASGGVAGSVGSMAGAVRLLVRQCGIPLADALVMAAGAPATSVGAGTKGSLAPGADADVVILDRDLHVVRTIARGQTIYLKEH